eukprot:4823540-Pleurochrysis_carterae.AAC.1
MCVSVSESVSVSVSVSVSISLAPTFSSLCVRVNCNEHASERGHLLLLGAQRTLHLPCCFAVFGTQAPTFFPPFVKDERDYVDAAIVANNPTLLAMKEAQNLWPGRPVGCVLSLGCGKTTNRDGRSPRSGLTYWAGTLLSMPMEVYRVHKEFQVGSAARSEADTCKHTRPHN